MSHRGLTVSVLGLAAAAVLGGFAALVAHGTTPGALGRVPERLPPPFRGPLALVAVHPQCPCLSATLVELRRALAAAPSLSLRFLVATPARLPPHWDPAAAAALAADWPRAAVTEDRDGALASAFGLATSGHVVLYDDGGRLLFSGGVTAGRGHAGDNAAGRALAAALARSGTPPVRTAVFGCPLRADEGTHGDCCADR